VHHSAVINGTCNCCWGATLKASNRNSLINQGTGCIIKLTSRNRNFRLTLTRYARSLRFQVYQVCDAVPIMGANGHVRWRNRYSSIYMRISEMGQRKLAATGCSDASDEVPNITRTAILRGARTISIISSAFNSTVRCYILCSNIAHSKN